MLLNMKIIWRIRQRLFKRMVSEYEPRDTSFSLFSYNVFKSFPSNEPILILDLSILFFEFEYYLVLKFDSFLKSFPNFSRQWDCTTIYIRTLCMTCMYSGDRTTNSISLNTEPHDSIHVRHKMQG